MSRHEAPGTTVERGPSPSPTGGVSEMVAFVKALPSDEITAFKALFRGARFPWTSFNGEQPGMGKAECERVEDWRGFYGGKLKDAGLFVFDEAEPKPALGMAPGSSFVEIDCGPTTLGWAVYAAWMDELRAAALEPSAR